MMIYDLIYFFKGVAIIINFGLRKGVLIYTHMQYTYNFEGLCYKQGFKSTVVEKQNILKVQTRYIQNVHSHKTNEKKATQVIFEIQWQI